MSVRKVGGNEVYKVDIQQFSEQDREWIIPTFDVKFTVLTDKKVQEYVNLVKYGECDSVELTIDVECQSTLIRITRSG